MARDHSNVFSRDVYSDELEKNGRSKAPHLRGAEIGRAKGGRSNHERCPRCRKLRMRWMPANNWNDNRQAWVRYEGRKVCHVCAKRLVAEGHLDQLGVSCDQDEVTDDS